MSYPIYYVEENDTLPILFDTFDGGTGASITMTDLAATDIEIYKDGGVTQRASDNGYTLLDTDGIDFDGITGIHGFSIDLSDNSDAGFYAVGSWYHVVVSSITVDGQTVNFVAAAFRILSATRGLAGTALPNAAADAAGGLPISDAGGLDLDTLFSNIEAIDDFVDDLESRLGTPSNLGSGATIAANLADIEAQTDDIGAAGAGLTAIPWNVDWDAEVESEVTDALNAYDPPTKTEMDTGLSAIETDTQDIQSRLPAALVSGKMDSDATAISGSTDAADKLEASAEVIVVGQAQTGTLSTTQMTTNLTETTDDHYNGRIIIWTSGALLGQATDITDYDGSSKMLTYTAVTEAPSNGDTFVII